ncbi:hypothetical protein C8R45DRAFT_1017492 [Mycena sanguinolenta]|nr:hypothetical protein C8R45DRAFT_1017492 [Mycena sanguinolenta]
MWMVRCPAQQNDITKDEPSTPEGGPRAFRSHTRTAYTPKGEFFRPDGDRFRGPGSAGDGREGGNGNGFRSGGHSDSPAGTPNTEQSSFLAPHANANAQSHSAGRGDAVGPFHQATAPFQHPTQFPPPAAPFQPSPFLPAAAPAPPQATRSSPPQPFAPPPDTVSPAPVQAGVYSFQTHLPFGVPPQAIGTGAIHGQIAQAPPLANSPPPPPSSTTPPLQRRVRWRLRWQREPAQAHARRPGWAVWRAYRPRRVRVRR